MAILKKEYEISVWDETLAENGQKKEKKRAIIGAHDMDYLGRATSIKFSKKLNGTSTLTFQMPSKFFDSKVGDYVHNELCDNLFNERKIKLKYDGKWYEYYVKDILENKQFKSIMYQYTCQDAFIDELSRNGYGITFDTELYNNVEEIGTFTNEILKDSIWYYNSEHNWGDFTEYSEEKLFKIPVSQFNSLKGYKLNYNVNGTIKNAFSGKARGQEMGDDKSREDNFFWDGQADNGIIYPLLNGEYEQIDNDGYIYIPYSQLSFCYVGVSKQDTDQIYTATETARTVEITTGGKILQSYALAPSSIDPTSLIQFIAIPPNAEVLIDEAGLLVNKEYSYVMTLAQWNKSVNTGGWYHVEKKVLAGVKEINSPGSIEFKTNVDAHDANKIVCYDGYLESINGVDMTLGKKISITDRTEMNISEEVDSFVKVYNNRSQEYQDYYTNENWKDTTDNYRVCSFEATRTIVPQLARNLVQNGKNISDTSGWQIMANPVDIESTSSKITAIVTKSGDDAVSSGALMLSPCASGIKSENQSDSYYSFLNFGIIGQKETISQNQVYHFYMECANKIDLSNNDNIVKSMREITECDIIIGEGRIGNKGDYEFINQKECINIHWTDTLGHIFIKPKKDYKNPYFAIRLKPNKNAAFFLRQVIFTKAYTKGIDFFKNGGYKYTGRDIMFNKDTTVWFSAPNFWMRIAKDGEYLLETDIVDGDIYGYQRYFIQQINTRDGQITKDTFKMKAYLNNDYESFALDPSQYSDEDYEIETNYIDLNKCIHYNAQSPRDTNDCNHPDSNGLCLYQKYGYCPYLFQTEKHCRKIRTLNGEKSNRFNLTQELSKIFEIYPVYYTEHFESGKIKTEEIIDGNKKYDRMMKKVFYITEKGMENKIGFRYEKNLANISRTLNSNEIVTKLYVEDVDSELSKTGLCSIKTAEDNPSRDNFIIDFSYYTMRGLLDKETTDYDLYGKNFLDIGYLKKIGYYNKQYDEISNKIIAFKDQSYAELEGNIQVNLESISTSQQEINKIRKRLSQYTKKSGNAKDESDTYKNYKAQLDEQENVLYGLIETTFFSNGTGYYYIKDKTTKKWVKYPDKKVTIAKDFLNAINNGIVQGHWVGGLSSFEEFRREYLDKFDYEGDGMMGQYIAEYNQIKEWKKQRATILKEINKISLAFFKKYEPFLKEGTWSDSNYLSDNSYYFGAKEVAKQGSIPKLNYNISVVDLAARGGEDEIYKVEIADTTYIEDIETFGINKKTGFPNRLKVIISGITYDLDTPSQNSIEIQNYTTQFEDLFEQVSASVQSLSFNENIYKRSSNFTATKNIEGDSLQGALNENQLTLLQTDEDNLHFDQNGQAGSDINNHNNKYKLDGQGLFFSNNGGQTWNVGVTPKGINADYIKVGNLDANRVAIVDGEYLYFLWDRSGITAYRTPQATAEGKQYLQDFARFNKYGLSLVEEGKIRLRAGYEYKNRTEESKGDISTESEINTETNIGFYLYNTEGQKIFATETPSDSNKDSVAEQTARINLQGELYVTNTSLQQQEITERYIYSDAYTLNNKDYYTIVKLDYSYIHSILNIVDNNVNFYNIDNLSTTYDFIKYIIYYCYTNSRTDLIKKENVFSCYKTNETQPSFKVVLKGIEQIKNNGTLKATGNSNEYRKKTQDLNKYSFSQVSNNSLFTIFYAINEQDCCIASGTTRYSTLLRKGMLTTVPGEKKSITTVTALQDMKNNIYKVMTQNFFSDNNEVFYKNEQTVQSDSGNYLEGQTCLYINNKQAWKPYDKNNVAAREKERLLCIAHTQQQKEDDNAEQGVYTSNIFTVLRNGNMYMGGKIQANDEILQSVENLPSEIDIKDYDIAIEDGTMKIDFTKIINQNDEDLFDFIVDSVNKKTLPSHNHKLKFPKKLFIITGMTSISGSGTGVSYDPNQVPISIRFLYEITGDSNIIQEWYNLEHSSTNTIINVNSQEMPLDDFDKDLEWYTNNAGSGTGGSGGFFTGYALPDVIDQ